MDYESGRRLKSVRKQKLGDLGPSWLHEFWQLLTKKCQFRVCGFGRDLGRHRLWWISGLDRNDSKSPIWQPVLNFSEQHFDEPL